MKRFIYNSLLFIFIFIIVIYIGDYVITKGLKKSKSYQYYVWNDIYNSKINSEVIFCGNSRAYVMLSPKVFDSILNRNTYNLGIDGWGIRMQLERFYIYMKHNVKPKYIIQNIDFSSFSDRSDLYGYEQFLPYLNDPMIINATNKYTGAFTIPERFFPLFRYNDKFIIVADGVLNYLNLSKKTKYNIYKGYSPQNRDWDYSFNSLKIKSPNGINATIDSNVLVEFESFLKYCNENSIKVILEFAPMYFEELQYINNIDMLINVFRNLSKKYNIPYLDYSHDYICNDKKYFYNSTHLNAMGSQIFSVKLANDVKTIIDNSCSE